MAHTAHTDNCCLKGCLTSLIVMLITVALIVGGIWYVLNMTFAELGVADTPIYNEATIRDLGLADTKVIDVIKAIKDVFKMPEESDIVTNPYNAEEADANLAAEIDMLLPQTEGGQPDYGSLTHTQLVTPGERYLVTLADTDLAYLMEQIIKQSEDNQDMENVKKQPLSFREVTIYKTTEGDYKLRVILKMDLSDMMGELTAQMQDMPEQVVGVLPSAIYFVCDSDLTVSNEGVAYVSGQQLAVNGANNFLMDMIMEKLNEASQSDSGEGNFGQSLGRALSEAFCIVINNIGEVGTAETGVGNLIDDPSTIQLGIVGVSEGQISMITRAEAPESETE
jgi:hypothetical protein